MATSRICSIEGCDKPHHARGLCAGHAHRLKKYGDPLAGETSKGQARAFFEKALAYEGDECLFWPFWRNNMGYGEIKTKSSVKQSGMEYAHRRMCMEAHGEPPNPKDEAAHSCGNGKHGCITKGHLSWKTRIENQADRLTHGTAPRGTRCGTNKLSEAQIHQIRAMSGKVRQRDMADQYGVSQSLVSVICSGKLWAWLA
ncbi:hypothetical protein EFV37_29085 [Mesorhizobium loti]|uniref:Uncharacterized protein n=1 Tax=Mesorhizobium jarvisii TaxID=1777867 RepID=A0A6M7TP49_9HYPH|nr:MULTISPECIES: hypothetical protein [Mesorhizobium]OBQ68893.1 hypothetical protein A9K72_11935 [Mesorhizobium loti]QKC65858.1 hypothetical protein EB229_29075 [Mesorhizobium jarvisii]QKD11772.1 hypothetical protein EFV37_29085 [Mesorhizobium loti]RJT37878.1 hypothetical protein D3242_01130 [Mesorhizobium jarvisii]